MNVKEPKGVDKVISIENYSSLEELFRITAWVRHFAQKLILKVRRSQAAPKANRLERQELLEAEKVWIEAMQEQLKRGEKILGNWRAN